MGEGTQDVSQFEQDQNPEALRRDITATREDMGQTLDEIEDRIRPSRIVERRSARVRQTFRRARGAVMGATEDVRQGARGGAGSVGGTVQQAGERARQRAGSAAETIGDAPDAALEGTRGNPLGAGLIAFGAGVVAAGLLPDSRAEQRVAAAVAEQLQPVKEELGEVAAEVGRDVADSARESARRTADHAREEAAEATREVRDDVSGSGEGGGAEQRPGPADRGGAGEPTERSVT